MTKRVIISIVSGLIGVLAVFAIKYALTPVFDNIKLNKDLKEAAEEENSKCPNTIAEGLVMDKVTFVKKDKKIIYEGRFIDYSISDFDVDDFKTSVTNNLIEAMEAGMGPGGAFDAIKNKNVIFEYVYLDYQYEEIARIKILINEPVTAVD
jgi:hypothetical protein